MGHLDDEGQALKRTLAFAALAVVVAAICIRLGFWQLRRLRERREINARLVAHLAEPQADLVTLRADSSSRLRRARVSGTPDYAHEIVLAARSYEGSPGVYLFTPLRVAGHDSAFLVNRGWVYAADGVSVQRDRWRERDTNFTGYAELMPLQGSPVLDAPLRGDSLLVRVLNPTTVRRALPYPVSPLYLVATLADSSIPADRRVARLGAPVVDDGPHLSYAIQWFSFATVAIVGAIAVVLQRRGGERSL